LTGRANELGPKTNNGNGAQDLEPMLPSQQRETLGWVLGVAVTIAAIIGITFLLPPKYAFRATRRDSIAPRQPAATQPAPLVRTDSSIQHSN
jgi:hypothetical protein